MTSSESTMRRMDVPGLYCPGLIEAPASRRCSALGWPRFRGSIAPASLKRGLFGSREGRKGRFRGSIAPASLKQVAAAGAVAGGIGFRGSIAPASLKRHHAGGSPTALFRFRGSIAPASLKPGVVCPLLIDRVGSGALLPRPH